MRALVPFAVGLLALSATPARSQQAEPEAGSIYVQTGAAPDSAFRLAVELLALRGHGFHLVHEYLRVVTTTPREGAGTDLSIQVTIAVLADSSGSVLHVAGVWSSGSLNVHNSAIRDRGMRGSPSARAWVELLALANSVPNGTVRVGGRAGR